MPPSERLWRLSRYWISDPIVEAKISKHINEFWLTNVGTAAVHSTWDAFKAYIRGSYQTSVSKSRHDASVTLAEAEAVAQSLESRYVLSQSPVTYLDMQATYREVMLLRVSKAHKQQLAVAAHFFLNRETKLGGFWHG